MAQCALRVAVSGPGGNRTPCAEAPGLQPGFLHRNSDPLAGHQHSFARPGAFTAPAQSYCHIGALVHALRVLAARDERQHLISG